MPLETISSSVEAAGGSAAAMDGLQLQRVPMWHLTHIPTLHIQALGFAGLSNCKLQTFFWGSVSLTHLAKVLPASTKGKEKRKSLHREAFQPRSMADGRPWIDRRRPVCINTVIALHKSH